MEKISRILPPSNRVTTVDAEASPSLRPGAPAMGRRGMDRRREEVSAPASNSHREDDRLTISQSALDKLKAANPSSEEEDVTPGSSSKRNSESAKIKIVEDLNRKFFANLRKELLGRENPRSEQIFEEENSISN